MLQFCFANIYNIPKMRGKKDMLIEISTVKYMHKVFVTKWIINKLKTCILSIKTTQNNIVNVAVGELTA